ncbi:MAG TPA: T9SS type A sorting domain-containing protein [Bacteroidales bacterium]
MKGVLFSTLIFLLAFNVQSQDIIEKLYDYSEQEYVRDIVKCDDGGYFILGASYMGNWRAIFLKIDNNGDVLFYKMLTQFYPSKMIKNNNGYYAVGYIANPSNGFPIGQLVCLNESGNVLWTKEYPYTYYSYLTDIVRLDSGDLLIIKELSLTEQDYELMRSDSLGNNKWIKDTYGNNDIIINTNNEIVLTGNEFQDLPEPQFDDTNWPTLEKFDFEGTKILKADYPYMNWGSSISSGYDGNNYYMATDNHDYELCKLDNNGDTIWTRNYDNNYSIHSFCNVDGDLMLATGSFGSKLFILSFSTNGDSLNLFVKDNYQKQSGTKLFIDNDSVVLIGNVGYDNSSKVDMCFLKMPLNYLITGIKEKTSNDNFSLSLFPNPFSTQFTLENLPENKQMELVLMNTFGQIAYRKALLGGQPQQRITFNQALASGLYILKIYSDKKLLFTQKVVKQ